MLAIGTKLWQMRSITWGCLPLLKKDNFIPHILALLAKELINHYIVAKLYWRIITVEQQNDQWSDTDGFGITGSSYQRS